MPEQHEWEFVVPYYKGAEKVFVVCRHKDCKMVLTKEMAVAMLNEYETLKKATDALSAERASKMADEMETDRRISTARHIRELRAYVEILEGK